MRQRLRNLAAGTVMTVTASLALVATGGPAMAAGTGYWVNNTVACSDVGAGTQAAPFCTIAQGTKKAVLPGDTVHISPGTYREQITVGASGTATDPITVTGDGPGVVVLGTRALGGAALWTATSTTAWSSPYAPPSPPRQVFLDGRRLAAAASAATTTANSWYYDATAKVLYVDAGGTNPGDGHQIEAGAQSFGVTTTSRQNVVISNLQFGGQNFAGVRLLSSSAITVDHVTASQSASNGILVDTCPNSSITIRAAAVDDSLSTGIRLSASSGVIVTASASHHNGLHGIGLSTSTNNLITGNTTYANTSVNPNATSVGIDVNTSSPDNTITGNVTYQNQDSGIQVYSSSHRALVARNISYGNGDHGLDTLASTGVRYLNNTSYGNRRDGLSIEGNSTGATIANNLLVDNGTTATEYDLYVDAGSYSGFTGDYDTAYNHATASSTKVNGTIYKTLAAFATATGQESHGQLVDPDFAGAGSADFRLTGGSAAVDSANAGVTGFASADQAGNPLADDPIVPDSGSGSPAYADRGALEFQPVAGVTNYPPHATAVVDPAAVNMPPSPPVTVDASGSSDADLNGITSYTFDFGDGTVVGPQPAATATHKYTATGTYTITVTVTDAAGLTDIASGQEVVSNRTVQTYSVEQTNPSCSDTGPGTVAAPFCTISAAAKKMLAGDTTLVGAGQYREQVLLTASGEPGAPITLRATSPSAVIVGSDDVSDAAGWTATSTTAWKHAFTPVPSQVFLDGQSLPKATSSTTTSANSWYYDTPTATLYVDTGGANPASGHTVAAGARSFGLLLRQVTDVNVTGLTVRQTNLSGVYFDRVQRVSLGTIDTGQAGAQGVTVDGSDHVALSGIQASANLSIGVRFAGSTDSEVRASATHDNNFHGVSVQGGARVTVAGVTSYRNKRLASRIATGIDVSLSSRQTVVEQNLVYGNDDSGIEAYTGATGTIIRRNIAYDNGDHGIDDFSAPGSIVVGNTVVGNATAGINFEGGSSGATSRNNVTTDNAVGSTRTIGEIRVDESSAAGTTLDRDLVHKSNGGPLFEWASQPYTTLAAYQTASGQEPSGKAADPRFAGLTARDLHLTGASPAIDAADTATTGSTDRDRDGVLPVDDPAVANTGVGPTAYADLGAYEYVGPVARATASPAGGFAPMDVRVDGSTSVGLGAPITSYLIACGNGTTIAQASGTCSYPSAGSFTPTLTVTDTAGLSDTWTNAPIVVQPNGVPTARLTATPVQAYVPQQVVLDASTSSDADGRPLVSYVFDCGNGQAAGALTTAKATCNYQSAGTFTAAVTVTDTGGLTSRTTAQVSILADVPPTAVLTLNRSSIKVKQAVQVDASKSTDPDKTPIVTYTFDCGSGAVKPPQAGPTTTCSYTATGTYVVRVTVADTIGSSASASKTVQVTP
ncbi:right-handed parallel beta-helix repeat-containing protein [Kribbella sp. VKM Ac-2566]|uniref:right-handed parallel beta-helix repeat-containing protein n=1 Tax=Kribbella sp. VKM Ac-2566 TaxID=2512218 RepID=UPI0010D8CF53|nr:right-handed parallel beta-helix repeat-containing protein [Kribbella sp. VKM Ac-2566]TDX08453.1 PKD repeat protein [Kribbella sp. VKM Ac-2566]